MTGSSIDRVRELNREACRRYRERNRETLRAKAAERRAAKPEEVRASTRRCMARLASENPEKYRQKWREKNRRQYVEDPARVLSRNKAYRHRRACPAWANRFVIQEMYELARLRTEQTSVPWEVDHVVPLQSEIVCGLHVEHNLRVIPQSVNRKKGNASWPGHPDPARDISVNQSFFS